LYSASLKVKCQTPRNVIYCNTNSTQPWKTFAITDHQKIKIV